MKKTDRVLIVGCGSSNLGGDLWKDGFRDITSVDYSEVVIDRMSKLSVESSMRWVVADVSLVW